MTKPRRSIVLALITALLTGLAGAQAFLPPSHQPGGKVRVADEPTDTSLAQAETALENKDYATAESLLKKAAGAELKDDARIWFDLGFLYNVTGRKPEAIEAYTKSVATDPQLFESNLNLGLLLAQAHDPRGEKYLRAATQLKPTANPDEGLVRAWLSLGHVIENHDPAGALAAYAQAALLQPKEPEPHISAGALLKQQEKTGEAEREFRRAAELDPKSADALLGLADLYQKSGRLPEAETALAKYIELEPKDAAAYFQRGRILLIEHRRYEAIDAYETGLKVLPSDVTAQRELAVLYDIAGQFDRAETLFRSLLSADAGNANDHAGLGSVLLHGHKNMEAQKELLEAVRLNPALGEAYGDLALAASENKNYALTIRALDARAKMIPDSAGIYFLRATAYDHLRDKQRAAENYRQFLRVAQGRFPDQEWQAEHRLKAIETMK